ncbi:maker441 [Drosophila busckii]|uniref:Maker441 n=1 Tax=Drosophila busckii TaxID=30019 RepID=A0A0M4E0R7_DROBS|nr:maker441 [Drosophila busckii]
MLLATWRRVCCTKLLLLATLAIVSGYAWFMLLPKQRQHNKQQQQQLPAPRRPQFRLQQNGNYWIYNEFMRAQAAPLVGNSSITLTTYGNYRELRYLQWLLVRWSAPISLALYVRRDEYEATLQTLYQLQYCSALANSWSSLLSVQLVFADGQLPADLRSPLRSRPPNLRCQFNDSSSSSSQRIRNYPRQLLMNVARLNARTHFIFALELRMLPTLHFVQHFLHFALHFKPHKPNQSVYCVRSFPQVAQDQQLPKYKSQLRQQLLPYLNYSLNLTAMETKYLADVAHWLLKRGELENDLGVYEISADFSNCAAYVSSNAFEPLYDQHWGKSFQQVNAAQLQILSGLGFDFIVLDGTFLIRRQPSWLASHPAGDFSSLLYKDAALPPQLAFQRVDHINELIKLNKLALGYLY